MVENLLTKQKILRIAAVLRCTKALYGKGCFFIPTKGKNKREKWTGPFLCSYNIWAKQTLCLRQSAPKVALGSCPKWRVTALKGIDPCDTSGRQSHPEFCIAVVLPCAALSPRGGWSFRPMQSDLTGGGRVKDTDESGSKSVAGDSGVSCCLFDRVAGGSFFFTRASSTAARMQMKERRPAILFFCCCCMGLNIICWPSTELPHSLTCM